ncbi:MAG: tetratricopeptide repeat protein [Pseudomonadota bacterium]|jgi:cytochrome c-type biogenesis protein CcmH|nr:tetratricopeptide repeat protein [Sphingomonas sp.]MDQ3471531.1 tetratricopeptide repeat protein [Pseudomonadota bacterium]
MSGWILLALLAAMALGALWLLGTRAPMMQLAAAALLLGCAGYAVQGSPAVPGSPRAGRSEGAPVPLTAMRHAFFGNFAPTEHWLLLSEALARRGNSSDAVGALNAAVRQYPNDPQLWVGLGNALVDHARGLTPASEFAYRRAAELSPGYPAPPFFFGLALLRSGNRDAALATWREVLADAPADASWRPLVEDAVAAVQEPPRGR